jgi:hypothetical protein
LLPGITTATLELTGGFDYAAGLLVPVAIAALYATVASIFATAYLFY